MQQRRQGLKSNVRHFGPYRTGFAAKYPYWCSRCKTFVPQDHIQEQVRDGDWGDYVAFLHNRCGQEVSDRHITHPRRVFADITSDNSLFNSQDKRTKKLFENAFDAAFAEFKGGQMSGAIALEFESALSDVEVLLQFLKDENYVSQW